MAAGGGEGGASSDEWALCYVSVNYVREITEGFDEDMSGFLTIKEVNDFTDSRPLGWRWVPGNLTFCALLTGTTVFRAG